MNRIVASNLIAKSARLRDLFLYLCGKALDESIDDIHELELGHKVFGRPEHYDTAADNIVRVHASLLRKRLAEYFQTEGENEPLVVEIPKGNYAPIFRKRELAVNGKLPELADVPVFSMPSMTTEIKEPREQMFPVVSLVKGPSIAVWSAWGFGFLTVLLASLCAFLLVRSKNEITHSSSIQGATIRQFWSGIFQQGNPAHVVLDDASLEFYQQVSGRQVSLTEYFDRSYLHPIGDEAEASHLDPKAVQSFLLKRQSNFSDVNLVGRLSQTAEVFGTSTNLYFARDFSFRQLKSGNIILLGTRQSNPWIQALDSYLALRWKYDPALDSYYPIDITAKAQDADKFRSTVDGSKTHDGYASIAFLPNVSGTGNILVISGTGGAAIGAALDFLKDESSMLQLRSRMGSTGKAFPYFEALLKTENGGGLPRSVTIILSRSPKALSSSAS
ncbi:hypothetical protein [Edaphobacter albus]|uniref:hypothetical protein n=1 Tax=Edaphobacter sp. 4G125 TaxID=2763071 RepID=UPI001645A460|nr:hypothetical protein [Edaphobacter sp. 4G125]QNI35801.1 hypothetical protein H7846_12265 [Edaphobacter sp. 4G125]